MRRSAPSLPVTCDDGIACTADRCSEAAQACESIPDNARCPEGLCDVAAGGCVMRPCLSADECSDGFFCNGEEVCAGGRCAGGTSLRCDDGISCTVDECVEATRSCTTTPVDARCDDGRFCNGPEVCAPMGCTVREPVICDDMNRCTIDACDDAARMCVFAERDADGDTFSLTSVTGTTPRGGSVAFISGVVRYTPPAGFTGEDTISVTLTDGRNTSGASALTVSVEPPRSELNQPQLNLLPGGQLQLRWQGIPGRSYAIQWSSDLSAWSTISTLTAGPLGDISFTDSQFRGPSAYYRIAIP